MMADNDQEAPGAPSRERQPSKKVARCVPLFSGKELS